MTSWSSALAVGVLGVLAPACSKTPEAVPAPTAVAAAAPEPGSASVKLRKQRDRRNPVIADAPPLALEVSVGGAVTIWKQDAFDKVTKYKVGTDGEGRDSWSLRDLATTLVGPGAHVTSVTGADGAAPMDPAGWADAGKTPILHTTRRGTLKFTWADDKGVWGDTVVKDVTRIEIAR